VSVYATEIRVSTTDSRRRTIRRDRRARDDDWLRSPRSEERVGTANPAVGDAEASLDGNLAPNVHPSVRTATRGGKVAVTHVLRAIRHNALIVARVHRESARRGSEAARDSPAGRPESQIDRKSAYPSRTHAKHGSAERCGPVRSGVVRRGVGRSSRGRIARPLLRWTPRGMMPGSRSSLPRVPSRGKDRRA
jgi:hypothetical protein